MQKAVHYIIITVLLFSCSKEKEIDIHYRRLPVINCIFSTDSIWKVNVSLSGVINNPQGDNAPDAVVKLYSDNVFSEQLVHAGSGVYISPASNRPAAGVEYRIEVEIPGYAMASASNRIPAPLQITGTGIDSTVITFVYNPFYTPAEVFTATLKLSDNNPGKSYYLLQPYYYRKEELNLYKVTPASIDSLRKYGLLNTAPGFNDSLILSVIFDTVFYGKTNFVKRLTDLYQPRAYPFFLVNRFAKVGTFNTRFPHYYQANKAYVNDIAFNQQQDYYAAIFGEKKEQHTLNIYPLNLFSSYYPDGFKFIVNGIVQKPEVEYYVLVSSLSQEGYKYYSTYIQNIASRGNPFAEPKNVYSNINNGTGIFAGRNSTLVRIW
jgi:Domain of unknown function (DUF4249)